MRVVTAGESHGPAVIAIVSDVPAGIPLSQDAMDADLARRQVGYGRGGRMSIEADTADVLSGVRQGRTLGSPVAIRIANRDWENWRDTMDPFGRGDEVETLTAPRPGHADLPGMLKTGSRDARDVLERASARETAARVAAGAVARALLSSLGVTVRSAVTRIGGVSLEEEPDASAEVHEAVEASDVRCSDPDVAVRMRAAIDAAREAGESLGGVFVVWAEGLLPGLGGYADASARLDARLAGAVMSIPAIKGVEVGDGFALAGREGSAAHDEIVYEAGEGYRRTTNRAGGLEGGMTNGEVLVVRAAMKPIPTLMTPLKTVDTATHEPADASKERSDVCAVPSAAVVAEAEVAVALAGTYTRKFGQDALDDMRTAIDAYVARVCE